MSHQAFLAPNSSNLLINHFFKWLPIICGILLLYVPTIQFLSNYLWNTEEQAHGPIILLVVIYLFWQKRSVFLENKVDQKPLAGSLLLGLGLIVYAIGRSQEILLLEIGSLVPVLSGVVLITLGYRSLNQLWFAIFFTIFMIPIPSVIVDFLTNPLKQYISIFAEQILYEFGYPIARSGVTISIGSYQLLVANACSGLHSMFSLSALGFLYLYLMQYQNLKRNAVIILSILPIAFLANLLRVMTLILVTYYYGDEVGQGFVHKFAGMLLFLTSLIFLFVFDSILGRFSLFKDQVSLQQGRAKL